MSTNKASGSLRKIVIDGLTFDVAADDVSRVEVPSVTLTLEQLLRSPVSVTLADGSVYRTIGKLTWGKIN